MDITLHYIWEEEDYELVLLGCNWTSSGRLFSYWDVFLLLLHISQPSRRDVHRHLKASKQIESLKYTLNIEPEGQLSGGEERRVIFLVCPLLPPPHTLLTTSSSLIKAGGLVSADWEEFPPAGDTFDFHQTRRTTGRTRSRERTSPEEETDWRRLFRF